MKNKLFKMLCLTALVGMTFASCEKENNSSDGKYTVKVVSADTQKGQAYGSGEYDAGTVTRIWGTPEPGYQFDRWNDGNKENPRSITVNADMTFTAYFVEVGSGTDTTGGNPGDISDDFACEFTFDGTHYDGGAYVCYGEEGGVLCLAIYSGVEETDPIALINIEPRTGTQTADGTTYVSCAVVFGYDDYVNDIYPHYGTAGPGTATITVTALDLTAGTASFTASGSLLDIATYESSHETVLKTFSANAEGHWQVPSQQK